MTTPNVPWADRFVGARDVDPASLLASPDNPKIHPRSQVDALEAVLRSIGWLQPIIVNHRTGHVLDGHARVLLALRKGEPTVPIEEVDLDPDEERAAIAILNRTASLAVADPAMLDAALRAIRTDDPTIASMLSAFAKDVGLLDVALPVGESPGLGTKDAPETTEPDRTPVRAQIGDDLLLIPGTAYDAWEKDIRAAARRRGGRERSQVLILIRERLGL